MRVHLHLFGLPIHGWNMQSTIVVVGKFGEITKCYNKLNKKDDLEYVEVCLCNNPHTIPSSTRTLRVTSFTEWRLLSSI